MKQTSTKREIWIGLVEIVPGAKCDVLEPNKSAFTSVLTFAFDEAEYKRKTTEVMRSYGAIVVNFENVEPFVVRFKRTKPPDEIAEIADNLKADHTVFATFYTFPFNRQ